LIYLGLSWPRNTNVLPVLWGRVPWCAWSLWWLDDQLQQRRLSVGTVDSFRGQERDIIAITLTRSNPQGEIGFLSDIRRMTMGMTRALSIGVVPLYLRMISQPMD
jgi:hypothetical protein